MSNNPMSIINDVTAKAQANASYKEAYLSNPNQVLKDAGLEIPAGITVHVIAGNPANSAIPNSTSSDVYLVYPEVDESIKDESLATAASASCQSTSSTCFCIPSCISCASTASTNSCS
jgi:hypothetical protein